MPWLWRTVVPVPPDARIDRELFSDDDMLPLLIYERLRWSHPRSSYEESIRREQSLEPGPHAVLVLNSAWAQIFNGGIVQLLYNFGDRLGEAVPAAAFVGAPDYERLYRDVVDLLPGTGLPTEHYERSGRVEELQDDDAFCKRLEVLEDRYYELEEEIGTPIECALRYVHAHPEQFFLSEREAAADNDAFVARLVARVGPVERAGADELAAAEAEVGRPFPPLLRRLYMEVGAAGWGPERGFLSPRGDEGLVGAWRRARRDFHGPRAGDLWPDTLLPVIRATGGELICADASEPWLPLSRLSTSGPLGWYDGRPSFPRELFTLRGRLEDWLVAPD